MLVRYGQTAQARMLLAEKGLPSSANAGYELFDKLGSMGLTSFMQEITRVRALEGEIARTIQAMKGVKAARVHIVLPDTGSFRRSRQTPSASVIVRTESAGDFSSAPAIRHLVAAAVPGLTIDQVTVLNTDGTILASGGDGTSAAPGKMVSLEKTIGKELQDNIAKTLAPYLGLGNFEISVAARLNTDKRQTNETAYNPESRVERSVRVVKETGSQQNCANRTAVGVEQNVPAEQQGASRRRPVRSAPTSAARSSPTTRSAPRPPPPSARATGSRASPSPCWSTASGSLAALGDKAAPGSRRQAAQGGRAAGRLGRRHRRQARRSRHRRGARVRRQRPQSLEPVPSIGVVEHLLRNTGSIVNAMAMVAVTALLIWFGVRPAMRAILEPRPADAAAGRRTEAQRRRRAGGAGGRRQDRRAKPQPNLIADLTSKLGRTPQKRLEQMTDFDEEQAAAILKQWMHGAKSA